MRCFPVVVPAVIYRHTHSFTHALRVSRISRAKCKAFETDLNDTDSLIIIIKCTKFQYEMLNNNFVSKSKLCERFPMEQNDACDRKNGKILKMNHISIKPMMFFRECMLAT